MSAAGTEALRQETTALLQSELAFGAFGIADWYARRMGMHNHDDAFSTPWPRIWQCLHNDTEEAEYRKRLGKILTDKTRHK